MKKVICYVRTSKRDQHPENQIPELVKKANEIGAFTTNDFEVLEEQESTRKTRPIKEDVMRRCRQGDVSVVIVWKLDRWARSSTELNLNFDELKNLKVRFISLRDGIDLNPLDISAVQKMQYGLLSVFAEFEREIIRERVFAGLERARSEGKQLGRRKGSKDEGPRRKSGYWARWSKQTPSGKIPQKLDGKEV